VLQRVRAALAQVEPFQEAGIERALGEVQESLQVKPRELYQPLRVALTGGTISPGIFESVALLGRDETLGRIDAVLAAN
jgi:glutamyl-tRNA synthetase